MFTLTLFGQIKIKQSKERFLWYFPHLWYYPWEMMGTGQLGPGTIEPGTIEPTFSEVGQLTPSAIWAQLGSIVPPILDNLAWDNWAHIFLWWDDWAHIIKWAQSSHLVGRLGPVEKYVL